MAALCGVLWAGVVVAGVLAFRRRPVGRPSLPSTSLLGQPRAPAPPPRRARHRAIAVTALSALAAALWPPLAIGVVTGAYVLAHFGRLQRARAARDRVVDGLPDVVDLVAVAASAGLTVPLLVRAMAQRAPPPFADAFAAVVDRVEHGHRLADALGLLPERLGDPVRPLTAALVATERYGVPLGPTLEHLTYDARRERRRRADIAARRLPVRLCFPLVCCILPAFGLLTIAPLLAGAFRSLRL